MRIISSARRPVGAGPLTLGELAEFVEAARSEGIPDTARVDATVRSAGTLLITGPPTDGRLYQVKVSLCVNTPVPEAVDEPLF